MTWIAIEHRSQVADVRRLTHALALARGFDEAAATQAAIVATEAGTNMVKHAGGGQMLVMPGEQADGAGLWIVAADKGRGIRNLDQAFDDGYSTVGSAGIGLGAMRRLSDRFDVYSTPSSGTVISARLLGPSAKAVERWFEAAGLVQAMDPAAASGDAWAAFGDARHARIILCDGLGHGLAANEAAQAVVKAFAGARKVSFDRLSERLEGAARPTRGAAVLAAEIDREGETMAVNGAGNVVGYLLGDGESRTISTRGGVVGGGGLRDRVDHYPIAGGATLILMTDGLRRMPKAETYPGLASRDVMTIAALLLRDLARGSDDCGIVVVRRLA